MAATGIEFTAESFASGLRWIKGRLRLVHPFHSATPWREPAQTLEGELLAHYADQPLAQRVAVIMAIGTIALMASYHVHLFWPLAWVALIAGYHVFSAHVVPRLSTSDVGKQARNLRIFCYMSAATGTIYALTICFFPFFSLVEQAVASVIIAALCTGAVTAMAGYGPALKLQAGIALAAVVFGLAFLPSRVAISAAPAWVDEVFAFLIFVYLIVTIGHGRQVFRVFKESLDIRLRHVALSKELQAALKEAESANRAKTRFLASASHDLRQPIHTLSLFSAALSTREMDTECREIVDGMDTALNTLAVQLDTLLDISRLDAGVIVPELASCDLRPMLERLQQEYAPVCEDKGLDLKLQACEAACTRTDPALLDRILRNLLSNAVRYTVSGTIRISLRSASEMHMLAISDTGKGIPQAEQERIFEEFYQLDNPERDRTKGLGLGLPIVRRLSRMLSIGLDMTSTPGKGTTFELRLPAVENAPLGGKEAYAATDAPVVAGKNVLVIDDEIGIRRGMKTFLQDLGYSVSLADSTEQAVKLASREPPEIVLADLRLRGSDNGIQSIQSIRALQPGARAVLISGDTAPERLREAHDAGIELLH
ncbi:MAG: ATP-binding protein, partial [Nitrosospira sp.]|nr:ATP-binding protein [Nitrosospira sp.]